MPHCYSPQQAKEALPARTAYVFVYLSHERVGVTAPSEFYVGNDRAFQLEDNEESNKVLIMRFGNACCASRIPLSDFRMKGQLPPIVGS